MDFDGDGKDDLVVAGFFQAYGVVVNYSGLGWRDTITAPVASPTAPNFGDAMTSGDFNGDGYADLAVANPGELTPGTPGKPFGGGVWIFYGGPGGLDLTGPQHITQGAAGVPGVMAEYDMFGRALAAGDLNGDGRDDLAVGAPGEKVNGLAWAGSVTVLFGTSTGLTSVGSQLITQGTPGVPSDPEESDSFGSGLAIGDMTRDGYADLAISAPSEGEWSTPFEGGLIMLLRGSSTGLLTSGITSVKGADRGIAAIGDSMSIADIDGDGDGDLVAGAPRSWVGYILYVPGVPGGMDVPRARVISMETPGIPGDPHVYVPGDSPHSYFGHALSTGDVTGDGRADVLTGAMRYDLAGLVDAGAVLLIPGTSGGLTGAGSVMLTQPTASPMPGRRLPVPFSRATAYDYFGQANAILNLDGSGALDLVTTSDFDSPSGLVVELDVVFGTPRRSPTEPQTTGRAVALRPVKWWTGDSIGAYRLGSNVLHR